LCTELRQSGGANRPSFTLLWVHGNVASTLSIFGRTVVPDDCYALARSADARISAALR
jgi:hypothetical protein